MATPPVYGDTSGKLSGRQKGGNQALAGQPSLNDNYIVGDASEITGTAIGGEDSLAGGSGNTSTWITNLLIAGNNQIVLGNFIGALGSGDFIFG